MTYTLFLSYQGIGSVGLTGATKVISQLESQGRGESRPGGVMGREEREHGGKSRVMVSTML